MNKIKSGIMLYRVYCITDKIYFEVKKVCLEDDIDIEYIPNLDAFRKTYPEPKLRDELYYRTKEQAIQEAIKEVKGYIKSFESSIEEYKQILKDLENGNNINILD